MIDRFKREWFRLLVVACQAVTIVITYPLWQMRDFPPLLPALPLPAFDMGVLVLLSLVLVLVRPRLGVIVHTVLVVYACLIDQTRLQPEFFSLIFLMVGTLPGRDAGSVDVNAANIARAHLITLWIWAGINKFLSPAFLTSTGPSLMRPLGGEILPREIIQYGGYLIALAELSVGVLAIFPRTRRLAAVVAFGLHGGILLTLSPVGMNWNESVWAWNLALAFAGFALLWKWKEPILVSLRGSRLWVRLAAALLLITPAGFYFGVTDAYLAHNLYSSNTASADMSGTDTSITWSVFNVPMPPEHRLFEQFFNLTCSGNQRMTIRDSRWWFVQQGLDRRVFTCTTSEETTP